MKIETRQIEIRLADDPAGTGPGVLSGTLLTYGERATDRQEVFTDGALHWPDGGIILREQHNRQAPIVRFTPTVEGREVRMAVALPDTQRGRDAAVMVRNGTFRGLSVEFVSEQEGHVAGVREIRKATLAGAGLVDDPSFSGSVVNIRNKPLTQTEPAHRWGYYV